MAVLLGALVGCPPATRVPQTESTSVVTSAADVRWKVYAARRQSVFIKLDLPVVTAGMTLAIGDVRGFQESSATEPAAAASQPLGVTGEVVSGFEVAPYTTRILRGTVEGPLVEQLTGQPRAASDEGSYLTALSRAAGAEDGVQSYAVKDPMPLYLHVKVPATAEPGAYRVPITISLPGKGADQAMMAVEVTDIALPTEPRVLAAATTTVAELARIYPATYGEIAGQYLDRGNAEHKAAVEQLDALVKAGRAQGVALFVEDIVPTTRVDELGQVTLDWDAYDRLMTPYMDGTAFEDRIPLPVWLAPVPPRRIRDSSTQLWQFIEQCAKHFSAKGWVATPAFLHPALAQADAENATEAGDAAERERLQSQVAEMMRLHMPREMLAVMSPSRPEVPHGQLWVVGDQETRLPPAGALGSEYSVRAWPWVCVARGNTASGSPTGVKGLLWRDALARPEDLKSSAEAADEAGSRPLLVVDGASIAPSLRMVWLNAGLNDAALLGLLERRTDPARTGMVGEILAGIAGRTGSRRTATGPETADAVPVGAEGFLYAGWAQDRSVWAQVTPMLQKLVLASDPGTRATIKPGDPLYEAAKLWLAQARRPVARVTGFGFSLRPGARGIGSDILDARLGVVLENPIGAAAEMDLRFTNLPGDFEVAPETGTPGAVEAPALRRRTVSVGPSGAAGFVLPLAGHVDAVMNSPRAQTLEINERYAGAVLALPVQMPIYRMHALEDGQSAPNLDGNAEDWPLDNQTRVFGEMKVALRYLTRPDLLDGTLRGADVVGATPGDKAARLRWTYDKDYLYVLARCPEEVLSDERNTQWPVRIVGEGVGLGGGTRWWGTDGLQIVLGSMPPTNPPMTVPPAGTRTAAAEERMVKVAFKPAGVVLVRTGQTVRDARTGVTGVVWREGSPSGALNVKYGIAIQREGGRVTGYTVEAAIPRAWIDGPNAAVVPGTRGPAWRANVLWHRGAELLSTSWAGPLIEDDDVAMMGALLGE
jgi:hypothetical protein